MEVWKGTKRHAVGLVQEEPEEAVVNLSNAESLSAKASKQHKEHAGITLLGGRPNITGVLKEICTRHEAEVELCVAAAGAQQVIPPLVYVLQKMQQAYLEGCVAWRGLKQQESHTCSYTALGTDLLHSDNKKSIGEDLLPTLQALTHWWTWWGLPATPTTTASADVDGPTWISTSRPSASKLYWASSCVSEGALAAAAFWHAVVAWS